MYASICTIPDNCQCSFKVVQRSYSHNEIRKYGKCLWSQIYSVSVWLNTYQLNESPSTKPAWCVLFIQYKIHCTPLRRPHSTKQTKGNPCSRWKQMWKCEWNEKHTNLKRSRCGHFSTCAWPCMCWAQLAPSPHMSKAHSTRQDKKEMLTYILDQTQHDTKNLRNWWCGAKKNGTQGQYLTQYFTTF